MIWLGLLLLLAGCDIAALPDEPRVDCHRICAEVGRGTYDDRCRCWGV